MKISLRLVLVVPLVLQIVAIAGVTGYLSWRNGQQTVRELADRLLDETTERIGDRLDSYLETPHQILEFNRLAHSNGNLDVSDFKQLEDYFWQQINVFDGMTAIGFGNEQGQLLSLSTDRGGIFGAKNAKLLGEANLSQTDRPNTFTIYSLNQQGDRLKPLKTIPNYDPRQIHWYQTAQKAGKRTWTKIVPYFVMPEASIFAATPMYQNGELQGVMFVNLMLEDISRFLDSLDFSPSGQTFIIERSGELVATSTLEQPFVSIEGLDLKRLGAIASQNPLAQKAMQSLVEQQIDLTEIAEMYHFRFNSDRDLHFARITPYQDGHGLDWLIVTIVPESDFAAQIAANTRQNLWLSLGAMAIAIIIGTAIAEWIARPIRKLSKHSAAMSHGDLNQQMPEPLRIVEIDRMANSFNLMAVQLRQSFESVQTALRQSEAKYATIFRNSPDSIDLKSLEDGRWIDVNDTFLELTGYTRNEVIGRTLEELNISIDPEQLGAIAQQLQTSGVVRNQEVPWRNKSGNIKISLVSCEIIQIDGQSYVLSISKDISNLKQTQAALAESEAQLRQLTENLPIFLGLRTADTDRWLYVSPGFEQITGGTVREMYDRPLAWQNYIHPDDREQFLGNKPLPTPTEPWTQEFRIVRQDGAVRWLRSTLYPVRNETGEIYRICTISEDISDRKQTEIALTHQKQQEQVLSQVIQNIHQSLDLSTIFSHATRGIAQLLNLDRAVIVRYLPDLGIWRHISAYRQNPQMPDDLGLEIPDRANPLAAQLKQNLVVKIEDTNTIVDPINRKLTHLRQGSWLLVPLMVNGSIWGSLNVWKQTVTCWSKEHIELARHITQSLAIAIHEANLYQQSQEAEAALKKSEARYRGIVEDQTELIVRYQPDGTLTFANQAYFRYFRQSPEDLLGHNYSPVIYEADRELVVELVNTLSRENPVVQIENRVIVGDEIRWTQWINRIIFDAQGKFIEVQAVGRDITEIKQAAIALKQAKEAAEAANRAKSEFLANMSHEIRTPLNAILGFTDFLIPKITDSQHRNYLHSIISSGRTLLTLINDILDLSKIEAGKLTIEYEPVNLRELMIEVQQIFNEKAHQKNLFISLRLYESVPELILFDHIRLRQILFNTIGNAIKFTEEGYIKISLKCQCDRSSKSEFDRVNLELKVEDTGIGIAPEQQQQIFKAFVQSDGQSTRKYGGTGLGLAITKRLTDLLGGTVNLVSELGKGSTFTFNFPQVQVVDSSEKAIAIDLIDLEDREFDRFPPTKILVVDDSESNLEFIAEHFAATHHQLFLVKNGLDAINQVAAEPPDLIFLDLWMPDMNGLEVAEYLTEMSEIPSIPIVFMTNFPLSQKKHQEIKIFSDRLLEFPVNKSQIFKIFQEIIDGQKETIYKANLTNQVKANQSEDSSKFETIINMPNLLKQLEKEEQEIWPELCRTQKQRDLKAFVDRLQKLAQEHHCQILLDYGNDLGNQLVTFDWDNLPKTLKQFPEVRAKIINNE